MKRINWMLHTLLVVMQNGMATLENLAIFIKLSLHLQYDSPVFILHITLEKLKLLVTQKPVHEYL